MTRLPAPCLALALVCLSTAPAPAAETAAASDRVGELTLEEKASLVTGQSAWETFAVDRLGIPAAWMADGPVGLRKSTGENVTESVPATCFPSSAGMAATWNPDLVAQVGAAIGAEARAQGVSLLLAPGLNIKRHPLGGRNFEYYSEDPLLSGRTAAAFVRGVQSQGVGATLKHFAVNNQEHRRMSIDARVAERPLRDIYLRGFEIAVKESAPQAVMSAYNRVNGEPASESRRLLTEILRQEWGFAGLVVSDWGAVDDPAAAIAAGLDLEMPGNPGSPSAVVAAVESGDLAAADLDRAAANVLQLADRHTALTAVEPTAAARDSLAAVHEASHDLARRLAVESMVLLSNPTNLLPFGRGADRICVVGHLADEPRIQGIGSSQINPTRSEAPWPFLERLGTEAGHEMRLWDHDPDADGQLDWRADLEGFLAGCDSAVVFAGQEASQDAEAWDRSSTSLAEHDLELVAAVKDNDTPFVVVLVGGASLDVRPFARQAKAVLMTWLGGQAFGSAVADVLFGRATPSGKLSETFAWAVADHPSALHFPGGPDAVDYGEGIWVGYRYFQTFDREVAYPFGHGLSYTTFEYTDAAAPEALAAMEPFAVSVDVANTGRRHAGAEIVQVYARQLDPTEPRPDRELVGFAKVALEPGEKATVEVTIDPTDLGYHSEKHGRRIVEPGDYELLVAASSVDVRAVLPLRLETGDAPPRVLTADDILGDFVDDPQGRAVVDFIMQQAGRGPLALAEEDDFFAAILKNLPFKKLKNFSGGAINDQAIAGLLFVINSEMPPEQVEAMLRERSAQAQEDAD